MSEPDFVIIGTGAAGTSAAFPLVRAGASLLFIDPDRADSAIAPPHDAYDEARLQTDQHRWQFATGRSIRASSPKFRVPTFSHVFRDFLETIGIETDGADIVGSLASGGLTNAWGAGIATFTPGEMRAFPKVARDLAPHYYEVAKRIGISGPGEDDLSPYLGTVFPSQTPHPLGPIGQYLSGRRADGLVIGRARLAVLTSAFEERLPCSLSGNCLYGCSRQAIWSARHDFEALRSLPNVRVVPGFVDGLQRRGDRWEVLATSPDKAGQTIRAKRVILAAGTIATTKIVLKMLGHFEPVRLYSNPTAAFALLFPQFIGSGIVRQAALAEHAFATETGSTGYLFPTFGLPVSEFAARSPLSMKASSRLLPHLLPAMQVGNVFFDGALSDLSLTLRGNGKLHARGSLTVQFDNERARVAALLRRAFRKLGAWTMPGSFAPGLPGSDIHYAGTIPMRDHPGPLETSPMGELVGHEGLHLVDGAVLPILPGKSHTFTIMANADRIGQAIARNMELLG